MTRTIVQRLLLLPFLLLVYSFVIFAIIHAPPGDFLTEYVAQLSATGTSITADQIDALRHEYGLDQPFIVQYLYWLRDLLHGNLGLSLEYQRPNAELIGNTLGLTVALAAMAFVLTWLIAVPAGIYSATHQRSVLDHVITVINYIGVATPNFMLALILMWIAIRLFRRQHHRTVFAELRRCALEHGARDRPARAYLAAGLRAGHRRHRAAYAHHARQPAG